MWTLSSTQRDSNLRSQWTFKAIRELTRQSRL
jgi:hypothetical protein